MFIVNADDWGRCKEATDSSLACYTSHRITSASAMVFMEDSARGADLAIEVGVDVGLHINLSEQFTGSEVHTSIRRAHEKIRRFLRASKYALLIYNPFLREAFSLVFRAQLDEFLRLYGKYPSHMDGHQHLHLCSNMLFQRLIPEGQKVRRSFSFGPAEKSRANRAYRFCVDRLLAKRHRISDYFFALSQNRSIGRLSPIVDLAANCSVELMVHPQVDAEYEFLMSDAYAEAIRGVPQGGYSCL